jgi:hypothetical protein
MEDLLTKDGPSIPAVWTVAFGADGFGVDAWTIFGAG